jgi:23S rRNA (uracil1939-C5)-methyltransferase
LTRKGEELVLTLETAAFEGKNIARLEGLVVFVHGGVPGDVVRARVVKVKQQFLEAEVVAVEKPSDLRVTPPCPHFGVCGGCKWQELAYRSQLEFKRRHVLDALERIGGLEQPVVLPTLGSPREYYYRNKMEFSFGDRWLTREEMPAAGTVDPRTPRERFALGLHIPERFDKVLDVHDCRLQSPESTSILTFTRRFALENDLDVFSSQTQTGYLRNLVIRESRRTNERMVNLVTRDERPALMAAYVQQLLAEVPSVTTIVNNISERKSQVALGEREVCVYGPGYITERLGSCTYRISANSFFQTNTDQAERLYDVVKDAAGLTGSEDVFDLYCGTGTIGFHVADRARRVFGIESNALAIDDARKNAEFNGITNCSFLVGDLKEMLTKDNGWMKDRQAPDVVIVDPPRNGMHQDVVRTIVQLRPRRVVYVSCNPATQARDVKIFVEEGKYVAGASQPVDMFPHTYHIENVMILDARRP